MLIKSLHIKGMLSFQDMSIDMRPLNVLIGPNASGKSNLIEIIALLQALPRDLAGFIRRNGGISDWLWKGHSHQELHIEDGYVEVTLNVPEIGMPLRYVLEIGESGQRLEILEERLETENAEFRYNKPLPYFYLREGTGLISLGMNTGQFRPHPLGADDLTPGQSVLHEIRSPFLNRGINYVRREFDSIHLYREWNMGRRSRVRRPQQTDAPNDFLEEDFSNLALVLNQLQGSAAIRNIEDSLVDFYDIYEQVGIRIDGNSAQIWIRERGLDNIIPATRLSDGTLRFLALLTILCHPTPPPLICIEEPELGLHPDIIPIIAKLLMSASQRTQLIVTTHSRALIDQLWEDPESVVVCERDFDAGSEFKRLSADKLEKWLERYELGELWEKGVLGGNRW